MNTLSENLVKNILYKVGINDLLSFLQTNKRNLLIVKNYDIWSNLCEKIDLFDGGVFQYFCQELNKLSIEDNYEKFCKFVDILRYSNNLRAIDMIAYIIRLLKNISRKQALFYIDMITMGPLGLFNFIYLVESWSNDCKNQTFKRFCLQEKLPLNDYCEKCIKKFLPLDVIDIEYMLCGLKWANRYIIIPSKHKILRCPIYNFIFKQEKNKTLRIMFKYENEMFRYLNKEDIELAKRVYANSEIRYIIN